MFSKRYDLLEKFLISYQTVYLEQTHIILLNLVDNHYIQWTNTTSLISRCGTFSPFFSLVILYSVLPSNFIVSGVKSSRLYPFLILNVTPYFQFYLHIFVLMVYQNLLHAFLKYARNNFYIYTGYDPSGNSNLSFHGGADI